MSNRTNHSVNKKVFQRIVCIFNAICTKKAGFSWYGNSSLNVIFKYSLNFFGGGGVCIHSLMFFEQYTVFHAAYGTQLTESFEAKKVFCLLSAYQKHIFHSALNYYWKHKRKYILQLFEDNSLSLFGICSTEKALVPYLCNCKVCFTIFFPFLFF